MTINLKALYGFMTTNGAKEQCSDERALVLFVSHILLAYSQGCMHVPIEGAVEGDLACVC